MNEVKRCTIELVERNWQEEVRFLRRLVRSPSTLGKEARAQRSVAEEVRGMGLAVDAWQVDHAEIARHPGYSPAEWSYEGRPNVAATWESSSGGGRSLILNGHIDVVPATPEHHWTYDPWGGEVEAGRMYGRGVADMKGGIAAMVYAVRALMEVGVELAGDVTLETVIEEECTGNGTLATLTRGYQADAAIVPEPFGQTALEAQVGVVWGRVTVRGAGAHAQRADQAVNALDKACYLMHAIRELEARANDPASRSAYFEETPHPLNYNVGIMRAGDWTASVPAECTFELRVPCYPEEDLSRTQARLEAHLSEAAKEDPWLSENPPEVSFYAMRAAGCTLDRNDPIFAPLGAAHRDIMDEDLRFYAFTGTTDVRFFKLYRGMSATCYGPVGGNLHAPDEWVDLRSVKDVTKVLALAVIDWCGV